MASESTANQKARIIELTEEIADRDVEDVSSASGSDGEEVGDAGGSSSAAASAPSKSKRKKATKALKSLIKSKDAVPQALVDEVLARVRQEQGSEGADEESVRQALEQMKIRNVLKGKQGVGGKGMKETGGHKFWGTQPVPQIGEGHPEEDGFIEPSQAPEHVRQDPYPLPKDFQWCAVNINDEKELREVYELLTGHYVEDDDATFRFRYSAEFLKWALAPPGFHKEWHVGVRVTSNKKLVAFISGVPVTLRVRENIVQASDINYLCIHKKLRSKRLAPVLIKEVTRQCHLKGVFQAIYTAGVLLPTPVSVCRYYHRAINVRKLVDIRFTYVPRDMTMARMINKHKLPTTPVLSSAGLREMEDGDVDDVSELYTRYMKRFDMVPLLTKDEIRHQFLSGRGRGDRSQPGWKGRRDGQVTWTYVVEDPESHKITDFFSFYSLPSTVIDNAKHDVLEAAYMFYYATETGLSPDVDKSDQLQKRLMDLVNDALVIAHQADFDVFNALTLMDNMLFLEDLKFGQGNGLLNFYLYNWRTPPLSGASSTGGVPTGRGVGVVML